MSRIFLRVEDKNEKGSKRGSKEKVSEDKPSILIPETDHRNMSFEVKNNIMFSQIHFNSNL